MLEIRWYTLNTKCFKAVNANTVNRYQLYFNENRDVPLCVNRGIIGVLLWTNKNEIAWSCEFMHCTN